MLKKFIRFLKEAMSEFDGTPSSSRAIVLVSAGLITLVWLGCVAGIIFSELDWNTVSGALEWGKNFFFVTVIPYATNKISGLVKK